jgi:hypothetical protein
MIHMEATASNNYKTYEYQAFKTTTTTEQT